MPDQDVVIGLGSNLGRPLDNLRKALSEIKKISGVRVVKVSSLFESEAQIPSGASAEWRLNFLNAAVLLRVEAKTPSDILQELKSIEKKLGRISEAVWAPRILDLDILYWKDLILNESNLKIPHARLSERPFALLPLLELLPDAEVDKPPWAKNWVSQKPFSTKVSKSCFWPPVGRNY